MNEKHTRSPHWAEDIAKKEHRCDQVPDGRRFVEVVRDPRRIDYWSRGGICSNHKLSASNRGEHIHGTNTLIVVIPLTTIINHFFDVDQFCGFLGSWGPSHEIGFTSTGLITGVSVSEESGP